MISSRCCTCLKLYPQNAPAFCLCGGSTFTTIHADDEPEAPTTSPEGARALGAALSEAFGEEVEIVESSFGPAAAVSTSGPTPPPSVSDSSSGSASAPQPGAAAEPDDESEAVDVGGVACGQQGCPKTATHRWHWPEPGRSGRQYGCEPHARVAEQLARTLGFSVDAEPL